MQLLAQGIERFLKLTYAMACQRESGDMPRRDAIRKYGHRLVLLADALVGVAERSPNYARRQAVQDDLEFIRANEDLRRLLTFLEDFGVEGRYHRLDEFLDPGFTDDDSPYQKWSAFETEIALRASDWVEDIQSNKGAEKMLRGAIAYIAYLLDRFGRSVARMWTLGALSDEARRYSPLVRPFLTLADAELGKPRKPV
jgi:hypothetical protein